jgi:hypothetical protein
VALCIRTAETDEATLSSETPDRCLVQPKRLSRKANEIAAESTWKQTPGERPERAELFRKNYVVPLTKGGHIGVIRLLPLRFSPLLYVRRPTL